MSHTFKVGDKVEIIKKERYSVTGFAKGWNDGPLAFAGRIGWVEDITDTSVHVSPFKEAKDRPSCSYYGIFAPDELIALGNGTSTDHVFRAGDRVIVHAKGCAIDGKEVKLRCVRNGNEGNWYFDVLNGKGISTRYCFGHTNVPIHKRFELVRAAEPEPVQVAPECLPRNPRWTDWDMTVVHTPTEAEYKRVVELCGVPKESTWGSYKGNTCVNVSSIKGVYRYQYADRQWYVKEGHTIITFAEFLKRLDIKEETKPQGDNKMSVSPQEVRNLKLTEEQRLLVEAGFTTLSGERTQSFDEVLMDKLAAMVKDEVVADLKLIAKAKKAAK